MLTPSRLASRVRSCCVEGPTRLAQFMNVKRRLRIAIPTVCEHDTEGKGLSFKSVTVAIIVVIIGGIVYAEQGTRRTVASTGVSEAQ